MPKSSSPSRSNTDHDLFMAEDSEFSPEGEGRVCSFQPEMFPQFNAGLHLLSPALNSFGSIDFLPSGFDMIDSQAKVAVLLFMSETQIDRDGDATLVRGRNQTEPPWRTGSKRHNNPQKMCK
jgi:hypothetical protein